MDSFAHSTERKFFWGKKINKKVLNYNGISSVGSSNGPAVAPQTHDQRVADSSPGTRQEDLALRGQLFCADTYFGIRSNPVLLQ